MGAWGVLAFDNDDANDWAYGLDDAKDLSLKVDRWVAAHPIEPPAQLIDRAAAAIDRILQDNSELRDLWDEAEPEPWRRAVADLRTRLAA